MSFPGSFSGNVRVLFFVMSVFFLWSCPVRFFVMPGPDRASASNRNTARPVKFIRHRHRAYMPLQCHPACRMRQIAPHCAREMAIEGILRSLAVSNEFHGKYYFVVQTLGQGRQGMGRCRYAPSVLSLPPLRGGPLAVHEATGGYAVRGPYPDAHSKSLSLHPP